MRGEYVDPLGMNELPLTRPSRFTVEKVDCRTPRDVDGTPEGAPTTAFVTRGRVESGDS